MLLLFVAASVATLIAKELSPHNPEEALTRIIPLVIDPDDAEGSCRVIVCYFHNTDRCSTCLQIEKSSREIIDETFAAELASKRLTWMTLNMEKTENRPYIAEFGLAMPTLIVMRLRGDAVESWIALDDTWGLIRNPFRFSLYVKDNVRLFLEGCS